MLRTSFKATLRLQQHQQHHHRQQLAQSGSILTRRLLSAPTPSVPPLRPLPAAFSSTASQQPLWDPEAVAAEAVQASAATKGRIPIRLEGAPGAPYVVTPAHSISSPPSCPRSAARTSTAGTAQASPRGGSGGGPAEDAKVIFAQIMESLVAELGEAHLRFPKEIVWLMGAPGAGKGTNTKFIAKTRGITTPPIVMSSLLNGPEIEALKRRGEMVSDRFVIEVLLKTLLHPRYQTGAIVDGFPRTFAQVEILKLLQERMYDLRRKYFHNEEIGAFFRRPVFRMTVLFVNEEESIRRQLFRGNQVKEHNAAVRASGVGELQEERATDTDPEVAAKRYEIFKDHYDGLLALNQTFPFHLIDASGPISDVEKKIADELAYQSSLELAEDTFHTVATLPVAALIIQHARQNLVRRLDNYQSRHGNLFQSVVRVVKHEFMPIVERQAIAGAALIRSSNPVFTNPMAINMALDVLSERGFSVSADTKVTEVPEYVDPFGKVTTTTTTRHIFFVKFPKPLIRRGVTVAEKKPFLRPPGSSDAAAPPNPSAPRS